MKSKHQPKPKPAPPPKPEPAKPKPAARGSASEGAHSAPAKKEYHKPELKSYGRELPQNMASSTPPIAKSNPPDQAQPGKVKPSWKGSTMKPCSACQGSGRKTRHDVTGGDTDYGQCPVCKGKGEVEDKPEGESKTTGEESPSEPAPGAGEAGSSPTSSSHDPSTGESAEPAGMST